MALFRRRKPLHQKLAEAADLSLGYGVGLDSGPGLIAQPPGWDGVQRGEAGVHGVPRARRWDTVTTAEAPGLQGDAIHFVTLPDRTVLLEEDEREQALAPLADAVESVLEPPYRAEAVRRSGDGWSVAAERIEVVEVPGLAGDEAELAVTEDGRVLRIDGRTTLGRAPALEAVGARQGRDYVVRATRLDGDLWQVEAAAL